MTASTTGSDLPIVVFSHGFGESMDGYASLAHSWAAHGFAVLQPTGMARSVRTPALLVAGDHDKSPLATRGPDRWTDAYPLSPADKSPLTLFGAEHTMGAIAGYSTHETTDPSLERIALIQQVTTAYLRGALNLEDEARPQVCAARADDPPRPGRLESK